MDDIPSSDVIGRPGTQRAYSCQQLEDETLCHFNRYGRRRTGWISTTSSLLRALQFLFIEHREQRQLFVICTAACKDIFSATELWDRSPGLKNNQYLRMKFWNEFLFRENVEKKAIVGCATVASLQVPHLDMLASGLSKLGDWMYKKAVGMRVHLFKSDTSQHVF